MSDVTITFDEQWIRAPHDFDFQLRHYVIAPDRRVGETLVCPFCLSRGVAVRTATHSLGTVDHPRLETVIQSESPLSADDISEVRRTLSWHLCLQEELAPFYDRCSGDPVMMATIARHYGAKDKASLSVFHALVDCICGQNTVFRRVYQMMENMTGALGEHARFGDVEERLFPTAQQIGNASEEMLTACKLGYRAGRVLKLACTIEEGGLDLEALKEVPTSAVREALIDLPGIGPYSADLTLILGFRRLEVLHLDLFVREALRQFYLGGREAGDEELLKLAETRWGRCKALAGLYLTTNTEAWSAEAGFDFRLRSGAES